jgi:predicted small lipoprotein YifL
MRGVARRGAAARAVMLLLAAAALLAACGRVGPVRPPGPPDQVTYPRAYPSR